MGLKDLLDYFNKYGLAGLIIAVLIFGVAYLFLQVTKVNKERIEDANKRAAENAQRADRFELEVKSLNDEIQKYFAMGMRVQRVMGEATDEIRRQI